jgi:hypothetical protein
MSGADRFQQHAEDIVRWVRQSTTGKQKRAPLESADYWRDRRTNSSGRHRVGEANVALGIVLAAYVIVFGLGSVWFFSLLQPRYNSNPGLAAYGPPPGTVTNSDTSARMLAQPWRVEPTTAYTEH